MRKRIRQPVTNALRDDITSPGGSIRQKVIILEEKGVFEMECLVVFRKIIIHRRSQTSTEQTQLAEIQQTQCIGNIRPSVVYLVL